MPFHQTHGLRFYRFDSFTYDWLDHGLFTRRGGVSQGPLASLNVGANVGDEFSNIVENKARIYRALDREPDTSFDLWQVHSAEVLQVSAPRQGEPYPKADGVVTDAGGVTLSMRFADCVPIMLVDPRQRAIAMVHAGWQGTVRGAAEAGLRKMIEAFGSEPAEILAGIGPCIRSHHYPVGPEVVRALRESHGRTADEFIENMNGQSHVDLAGLNASVLQSMGIGQIEDSEICTACNLDDWFSHRGQDGQAGRFAGIMGLR